jgi:hypothetical protein
MFSVEVELSLHFVDLSLFLEQFVHQTLELVHRNLHDFAAIGTRMLGRALLPVLVSADLDVLSLHFGFSLVIPDFEALVLGDGSLSSFLVLLVHPFGFEVSIGLLEGSDEANIVVLLSVPLLAHIFLLIALQFDRMLLMGLYVVIDLWLFGEGVEVGLAFLLEDSLERYFDVVDGGEILAEFDIDRGGVGFVDG